MAENLPDTNVGNIEYINKQVAIDVLDKEYTYGADIDRCGLATALDEIEALPAADVVPVVRCKNYIHHSYDEIFGWYWCELPGRVRDTTPDGFCEKGEE